MMSQVPKSSTSSEVNCKSSSESFFSQLRHLASDVENGIEHLQSELDPKKVKNESDTNSTLAINFLLHTKKDMVHLRDKAKEQMTEFSKENERIDRLQELMKGLLDVHSERLEKVESHLEKYGYKRPPQILASSEQIKKDVSVSEDGGSSEANNSGDDEESELEDNDQGTNSESPNGDQNVSPKQTSSETNSNVIRTPKLELNQLSEATIQLLQHRATSASQDENAPQRTPTMKESTFSFHSSTNHSASTLDKNNHAQIRTPEAPRIRSSLFTVNNNNTGKFDTSMADTSVYGCGTPRVLTPGFEFISSKNSTTFLKSDLSLSSMKDRFPAIPQSPEPPAVRTGLLTFHKQTRKFETFKNDICVQTPDTPTLVTPGSELTRFSYRDDKYNRETPDLIASQIRMKTPEAPTALLSGFKNNTCFVKSTQKGDSKSARSLFNTPELKSNVLCRNDTLTDNKVHVQSSQAAKLLTPKTPEMLTRTYDIQRNIRFTSSHKK